MSICKECGGTYYPTTADITGKCIPCQKADYMKVVNQPQEEPIYINRACPIGCKGNISVSSESEPTHSDILAAIADIKACIGKLQQGAREGKRRP